MKKTVSIILLLALVIVVSISVYAWRQYQSFLYSPMNITENGVMFIVKPGSNISLVSEQLTAKKLSVFPAIYLDLYARYLKKSNLIKAGEYQLIAGTTLPMFLEQIIGGKVVQYPYTVIEGMTSQQLISDIQNNNKLKLTLTGASPEQILALLNSPYTHLEGLFLPETYHFPSGMTDVAFLKRAYNDLQAYLTEQWQQRADKLPYKSPYEALIMASIIEKETGIAEERAQIAGVFVRRLNIGMRLQTDPTVIYGMGDSFDGNIRRKDLRTDTPYNTYTRQGLPPTPIALASKESIYAALHPADGKSLYFVATGKEGRHYFSSTLTEHNKAVRKYQLKK